MHPIRVAALLCAVTALVLASAAPPKAIPKPAPVLLTEERIDAILNEVKRFDAIDEKGATLPELLERLSKATGLPIELAQCRDCAPTDAALAGWEHHPIRLRAGTMTVEQRLGKILAACSPGLTFLVRRGHVEVVTSFKALRELSPTIENPLDDEQSDACSVVLPPIVRFAKFDGETLEDVCERIAARAGVSVAIDPKAKDAAATKVKARLVNVPVNDALAVVADMANLVVVRRGNLYYLATPKSAERLKPPVLIQVMGLGGLGGVPPGVAKK